MASRPRPGAFGPATGYGSRLRLHLPCRSPASLAGSAADAQTSQPAGGCRPACPRVPAGLPAGSVRGESHLDRQDENGKNQFNKSVRDEPAQR
jgi:hypothetical protein